MGYYRQARESKNITQSELAGIINKKREYISRIESNSENMTLKTLFEIVEKGLDGRVVIAIETDVRKKSNILEHVPTVDHF